MPQTEVAFLLAIFVGCSAFIGYKIGAGTRPEPVKESKMDGFLSDLDGGSGGMDPDEVDELMAVASRIIRQQLKQLEEHAPPAPKAHDHEGHDHKGHDHSKASHVHVEEHSGLMALGRRALAAGVPHSPGMLAYEEGYGTFLRLCWKDDSFWHCVAESEGESVWMRIQHRHMAEKLPWMTDGATIGIVAAHAREIRKDPFLSAGPSALHGWVAWRSYGFPVGPGATEAEAYIASIEEFNREDA